MLSLPGSDIVDTESTATECSPRAAAAASDAGNGGGSPLRLSLARVWFSLLELVFRVSIDSIGRRGGRDSSGPHLSVEGSSIWAEKWASFLIVG